MTFEERNTIVGLTLSLVVVTAYWAIVIVRAATDELPFTEVAWRGPLLWTMIVGGGLYAVIYGATRWRVRGQRVTDERDAEVLRHGESAGAGLTGVAVLAAIIMLTQGASDFWVAHVLFIGSFLGSLVAAGVTIAGYREGVRA
ncbi:hypothetical protein ACNI3K_03160 [Demequina sp. SO4-13]|uniref:hypothetical protein n=1 Tax=Demequina sp. SO4-13 TaxID=3401027 RepID=UPI003AF77276